MLQGLGFRVPIVRHFAALGAIAAAVFVASCGGGGDATAPKAASLAFVTQPATVNAGQPFTVSVELLDAKGKRVSATDGVTLTVSSGANISGPATVSASRGLATFAGVSITVTGANIQLTATSGLLTVTSTVFSVQAGDADAQQSSISPAPGNLGPNTTNNLVFTFKDAYNNPVSGVSVQVATSLAGATFTPTIGSTSSSGTFATAFKVTGVGSGTVTATVNGKAIVFSTPYVVVDLCPPAPLTFPGPVTGTVPAGQCVQNGLPTALSRFTLPAYGGVLMTLTPAFNASFGITTDPPDVVIMDAATAATAKPDEWLLPAGTYQFRVSAATGGPGGTFTATGEQTPVAGQGLTCDVSPIRILIVGGTYGGQALTSNSCQFTNVASAFDAFLFASPRACTITVSSTVFHPWLDLLSSGGVFIDEKDGGGVGIPATLQMTACNYQGGPILIVPSDDHAELGAYTLTITLAAGSSDRLGPPAPPSVTTPVRVTTAGQLLRLLKFEKHGH